MATQLFANNAESTLASGITAGQTSITLNTGDGALFPSPSGGDCFGNGTFTSMGHNLDGDNSCNLTQSSDQPGGSPLLGALQDNGGSTFTHALQSGSPALDAVPAGDCKDTASNSVSADQRGTVRPQGSSCDIGAYEFPGALDGPDFDGDGMPDICA